STTSTASRFGIILVNTTGQALNTFNLSYTGEEWRVGTSTAPQTLNFSYDIGSTGNDFTGGTFTSVAALSFTSPVNTRAGTQLDGTLSANQTSIGTTVNGFSWGPGQTLVLMWDKGTGAAAQDGLGVANVIFSAAHVNQFAPTITSASSVTVYSGQSSTFQVTT